MTNTLSDNKESNAFNLEANAPVFCLNKNGVFIISYKNTHFLWKGYNGSVRTKEGAKFDAFNILIIIIVL